MPICGKLPELRYRMIDDAGFLFLFGGASSSAFHFIKGLRNYSPGGIGRLTSAVRAVGTNAPRVAAVCGAYGAVFSVVETAVSRARGKDEDDWDFVAAGAATSGLFRVRRGAAAAARSTLFNAAMFAGVAAFAAWYSRLAGRIRAPTYRRLPAPVVVVTEGEKGRLQGCQMLLYGENGEKA